MSKKENRAKDKKDRLEQKEKIEAETQRSLAVAEMKKAHGLIEKTEKSRRRPILLSICRRIEFHLGSLDLYVKMLAKPAFVLKKVNEDTLENIRNLIQIHESIRFDFQKNMQIKDEEMNKLFPNIKISLTDGSAAQSTLTRIMQQLAQIKLYCERMLLD